MPNDARRDSPVRSTIDLPSLQREWPDNPGLPPTAEPFPGGVRDPRTPFTVPSSPERQPAVPVSPALPPQPLPIPDPNRR